MKIRINNGIVLTGCILLILMTVLTAGCIKSTQKILGEDHGETSAGLAISNPDPSAVVSRNPGSPDAIPLPATPTPAPSLAVDEVSPLPYITPDPYRFPYRDHGNWSTGEPVREKKNPQFTKSYVLRSNSTAVRVNVTQAPLVIDLTFNPRWTNPDHTSIGSGSGSGSTEEGPESESGRVSEGGTVSTGISMTSFVYSSGVVTVYHNGSRSVVEQDGFGKEFGSDLTKKITIYREGNYVITLEGDFIDINMAITTGGGAEKSLTNKAITSRQPDEGDWV